jgi:hypothetical protein
METPTENQNQQLANQIYDFIRQHTSDQQVAIEALTEATTLCRTGKPWTAGSGNVGRAGGGQG